MAVDVEPAKEDRQQLAHWRERGSLLLVDYLKREEEQKERIVIQNEDWVVLLPYWATWPYETLLVPRRQVSRLPDLNHSERTSLANILKRLLKNNSPCL